MIMKGIVKMKGYRIIVPEANNALFEEFSLKDTLNSDEVLVRIQYTLISNGTEKARMTAMPNTHSPFPYVPGYSGVGIVKRTGSKVVSLKQGDRVFVAHGGHANYNIKKASAIVKIPDNVGLADAVFTKMASFPLHAIHGTMLQMGESVVVVGLGALGLLGVQLAKIGGALPVVAIGNREIRRDLAKDFGADYVFAPDEKNLSEKVIALTSVTGKGADVVIETSGSTDALNLALFYTAKHGRISLNGCNRIADNPIDLYRCHVMGIRIIGSNANTQKNVESSSSIWTGRKHFMTVLGYMSDGRLTPWLMNPIIVPPTDASEIYDRLINDKEFPLGVIFDWTSIE